MVRGRRAGILVAALLGGACGQAGEDARITVRDSSGIRIVENPAEPPSPLPWRFEAEPAVDLGGDGDDTRAQLFRVAGAVRLSDGRIVVADGGSSTLKFFSPDGALLNEVGRPGEGPGEFRRLDAIYRLAGDSILTYDIGLFRVIVFDPQGQPSRETKLMAPDGPARASVIGVLNDGSLLAQGFIDLGGRQPAGLESHTNRLYHFSAAGEQLAELGEFPTTESFFVPIGGGGFSIHEPFFRRESQRVAVGDRIVIGFSDRYEIRFFAPDGLLTTLVRRNDTPRPVSATDVDRARDARLANEPDDNRRRDLERVLATMPVPATMPAFGRVRADESGNVWVENYRAPDEDDIVWVVFDAEGRLLTTLAGPAGFAPTHIGEDFALGTWRDAFDVEHVRLYTLARAEPEP